MAASSPALADKKSGKDAAFVLHPFLSKSVDEILPFACCKTANLVVLFAYKTEKGREYVLKLMLADGCEDFTQVITKQLKNRFDICRARDGVQTLKMLRHFKPDILVLDLHLSGMEGLEVLRTIRTSGNDIPVLVTGFLQTDWVCAELARLQVSALFCKPCASGAVVSRILDIAEELVSGKVPERTPENLAHHLLLNLGFRMGFARYKCVYLALMLKFQGECGGVTKCLYPRVARMCGGNTQQVEKAVRDAIKDAFGQGCAAVWQMYFPQSSDGGLRCPSNDVFLARMAFVMLECFGKASIPLAK